MNFFEEQDRARKRTSYIVGVLIISLIAISFLVYALFYFGLSVSHLESGSSNSADLSPLELFLWSAVSTVVIVGGTSLYKMVSLGDGSGMVLKLGATCLNPNTRVSGERKLLNVVEEMTIAAGMPRPSIYVLQDEPAINAMAIGTRTDNAFIVVTKGTVDNLTRAELQGVVAHELAHIMNGDMRINLRMIGLIHGLLAFWVIGRMLIRGLLHSSGHSRRRRSGSKGGGALLGLFLGLGFMAIGSIGAFAARLIKAALSRQRELLADASAAQFTRDPESLARALYKIKTGAPHSYIKNPRKEEVSHLFFAESSKLSSFFGSALATHPPIEKRILTLAPHFEMYLSEDDSELRAIPYQFGIEKDGAVSSLVSEKKMNGKSVENTGELSFESLERAREVHESIPDNILNLTRNPKGAMLLIYALLSQSWEGEERQSAKDALFRLLDNYEQDRFIQVQKRLAGLQGFQRLPLVELSYPALRELGPDAQATLMRTLEEIVSADKEYDYFEFAILHLVQEALQKNKSAKPGLKPLTAESAEHVSCILSALAWRTARNGEEAGKAFSKAVRELTPREGVLTLKEKAECGPRTLAPSLAAMRRVDFSARKKVLEACLTLIMTDEVVDLREQELLRAISAGMECPGPLLPIQK